MDDYDFVENHRTTKSVEEVGMFMNNQIGYKICEDMKIRDDFFNQLFIEIEKSQFALDKNIIIGVMNQAPNKII